MEMLWRAAAVAGFMISLGVVAQLVLGQPVVWSLMDLHDSGGLVGGPYE
jgi:hypothetical protein